jgi:hypothetical protein
LLARLGKLANIDKLANTNKLTSKDKLPKIGKGVSRLGKRLSGRLGKLLIPIISENGIRGMR